MMDGRILSIRQALEKAGYVNTAIMSYSQGVQALYTPLDFINRHLAEFPGAVPQTNLWPP